MDFSIVIAAVQLTAYLSFLALLAASSGALIAGVVRVVTQIEDRVISLLGRFTGIALFLYFMSSTYSSEIAEFASRIWGGADTYF